MIPEKIVKFLIERGNAGLAGFRDADLHPFGSRVCGWIVSSDGRRLTAFLPSFFESRVLSALAANGRMAVVIEEFPLHETYQVKGRYLSHRPLASAEVAIVNDTRERFATSVRAMVPNEDPINWLRASIPDATIAVEIEVTDVFVQTPGPSAGARIYPPEA
ncbi:MAG TPA: hypothetical protein VJP86_15880 [Vicinamibacterales bacterium]|jgi:hypothetical protein|nr:hypothetical protein [Vicinamibacterales bacterium]